MAFFDKLTSLAQSAGEKANTAIESGKISVKVASEEKRIAGATQRLGALVLSKLDSGEIMADDIMAIFTEIQTIRVEIDELKKEAEGIKAAAAAASEARAAANSAASSRVEEAKEEMAKLKEECDMNKEVVIDSIFCSACGAKNPSANSFCSECGEKLT